MKPFYLFSLGLALLLIGHTTRAQIVRVTNGQSLSALIASATAGTTFIVEPGSYGDLTLTKRVAIIGPGYFLGSNQQATTGSATFGTINFKAGSEGSILMSCVVNNYIYILANQITVSKCLVGGIDIGRTYNSYYDYGITSNVTIKQCFVRANMEVGVGINSVQPLQTNCVIRNNIVGGSILISNFQGEIGNNTLTRFSVAGTGLGLRFYNLAHHSYVIAKNNINNDLEAEVTQAVCLPADCFVA